jgi:zinc protease
VAWTSLRTDFSVRQSALDVDVEAAFGWFRDRPDATTWELRAQRLLPGDRAGTPWWERVRAARAVPQKDVLSWQRAVRHPAGSVLVVAGPVAPELVGGLATKYLGGWKGKGEAAAPKLPPLPPAPERQVAVLVAPRAQTSVTVSCRVPGRTDDNAAAHAVLDALVDGALVRSLHDTGGAWFTGAEVSTLDPRVGVLTLRADVWPGQAKDALAAMFGVLELADGPLPVEALARARLEAAGRQSRAMATGSSLFAELTQVAAEGRSVDRWVGLGAEIEGVDGGAVQAVLADCVGHEAATLIGPDVGALPDGERVDWAARGEALTRSLR